METAVEKGIALLNERVPGWEKKVRLTFLDMQYYHYHVLAWAYSSNYTLDGIYDLFGKGHTAEEVRTWEIEYGFEAPTAYPGGEKRFQEQCQLTGLWRRYIQQHQ
jgi:hypothetical protein